MLELFHDAVAIKPDNPVSRTRGGLALPDVAIESPDRGVVIAVGPGHYMESGLLVKPACQSGDHVLYMRESGRPVNIDGEDLVVMRVTNILGRIVDDPETDQEGPW